MYLISYVFLLIYSYLEVFLKKRTFLFPIVLILMLIAGLRYKVGKDYTAYENIFSNTVSIFDFPLIEPGFKYIIIFLKNYDIDTIGLFFLIGTVTLLIYYFAIAIHVKYKIFSLFLFFNTYLITAVFSGIRQGIAMGIFLLALNALYNKNLYKVFIASMVAFSIHVTGIIILLLYLVPAKYVIKKEYIIIFVLSSFVFLYFDFSNVIAKFFPDYILLKFNDYSQGFDASINLQRVLQRVLLILPFIFYYDLIIKKSDKLKYLFYLYLIGYFIYIVFSNNLAFATKINQFFRVLEIIMFPMLLELLHSKINKIILFVLLVIWSTLILLLFLSIEENYPYHMWITA